MPNHTLQPGRTPADLQVPPAGLRASRMVLLPWLFYLRDHKIQDAQGRETISSLISYYLDKKNEPDTSRICAQVAVSVFFKYHGKVPSDFQNGRAVRD